VVDALVPTAEYVAAEQSLDVPLLTPLTL